MFQIKICGVTRREDARRAAAAGADAIGLNFFSGSKRCVSPAQAERIVAALPAGVAKVGVFVNAAAEDIFAVADALGLDWLQLHGDEQPEFLTQLEGGQVVKALRCGRVGVSPLEEYVANCFALNAAPAAVLVDALAASGEYGGTGELAPWNLLAGPRPWLAGRPLILAGGLRPENVADAIRQVAPAAVDTAGGVESAPGVKDPAKLEAFVQAARRAFEELRG